jgi:hypothetical protein
VPSTTDVAVVDKNEASVAAQKKLPPLPPKSAPLRDSDTAARPLASSATSRPQSLNAGVPARTSTGELARSASEQVAARSGGEPVSLPSIQRDRAQSTTSAVPTAADTAMPERHLQHSDVADTDRVVPNVGGNDTVDSQRSVSSSVDEASALELERALIERERAQLQRELESASMPAQAMRKSVQVDDADIEAERALLAQERALVERERAMLAAESAADIGASQRANGSESAAAADDDDDDDDDDEWKAMSPAKRALRLELERLEVTVEADELALVALFDAEQQALNSADGDADASAQVCVHAHVCRR